MMYYNMYIQNCNQYTACSIKFKNKTTHKDLQNLIDTV